MTSFVSAVGQALEQKLSEGIHPVILCSKRVRRLVREVLLHSFPTTAVIAYSEVPQSFTVEQLGLIS